jgi:manganese transport system ATP-binding protein
MSEIEVDDLHVRYGGVPALDGVTLRVRSGCVTALIGINGSGKSTLFNAIMGLVRPCSGEVRIGGESSATARRHGHLSYVPQNEAVDWTFPTSVRDVVMMGRYGHQGLTRHPRKEDHAAVAEALEQVELTDLADRQIGQLSGGQKKRAFVARSVAQGAHVLLLDEPFAGLDKRSEAIVTRLLRDLAADGRTVFTSTHDLHGLPQLADEAVLLKRHVLLHGALEDVLQPDSLARAFGLEMPELAAAHRSDGTP